MARQTRAFVQPSYHRTALQTPSAGCQLGRSFARPTFPRTPAKRSPRCSSNAGKRPRPHADFNNHSSGDSYSIDFPPLGPSPEEQSGFEGWREEDDAYWRGLRERVVAFQSPNTFAPEDLESPPQPLDRHGNPVMYPAAAKYDQSTRSWVPTTEEEEQTLRNPNPVRDPYFVDVASDSHSQQNDWRELKQVRSPLTNTAEWLSIDTVAEDTAHILDHSPTRKPLKWKPRSWKVVHLGTSSAVPTRKRNVSSTAFLSNSVEPSMFLVDVGENTSRRLLQCDWCMTHGFRWIRAIFITHLHGDHIYGLPNLLARLGQFTQYRRRQAIENGEDGSDPVIRIFGPYGIRGFVRSSLYWTRPVGVRFSISELVPRDSDFSHIRHTNDYQDHVFVSEGLESDDISTSTIEERESPPPHSEEVRADDISVGEDGVWHVWEQGENGTKLEVVAAPLKHRLACFGYVFREPQFSKALHQDSISHAGTSKGNKVNGGKAVANQIIEIDVNRARELGVYGSQFRVLRTGRSVVASRTGLTVKPEDVAVRDAESDVKSDRLDLASEKKSYLRKVTILGDTCDSSALAPAASNSDLLIHEATFTEALQQKAKVAMHSTARMAGAYGKSIGAKKIALTHFSSRIELQLMEKNGTSSSEEIEESDEDEEEDFASPSQLVMEARYGYGAGDAEIVAAYDFMEHDIPSKDTLANECADSAAVEKANAMK